jgi:hypothetical protein
VALRPGSRHAQLAIAARNEAGPANLGDEYRGVGWAEVLERWQSPTTGAGRVWHGPDDSLQVVFITKAATGHPGETD